MRRWCLGIAICTALGVITTVGVSWFIAAFLIGYQQFPLDSDFRIEPMSDWIFKTDGQVGEPPGGAMVWYTATSEQWTQRTFSYEWGLPPPLIETRIGWPALGMAYRSVGGKELPGAVAETTLRPAEIGIAIELRENPQPHTAFGLEIPPVPVRLPVVVRPLAFAANASFYATLWFVLLFGRSVWVSIRGWRRTRRGACGGCGYHISDLVVCPECGAERP